MLFEDQTCWRVLSRSVFHSFVVPDGPPGNITEEFLGLGDVNISWSRPSSGPVFGYQLFYRRVLPELGEEMTVNITDPDVTETTLLRLESAAEYNVSMLAYAHLPVERSPFITFQLTGEPFDAYSQLACCGCQLNKWFCNDGNIFFIEPLARRLT